MNLDWSNSAALGRRRVSFPCSCERQTFRFPMPLDYEAHDEAELDKAQTQKKQKYIFERRSCATRNPEMIGNDSCFELLTRSCSAGGKLNI